MIMTQGGFGKLGTVEASRNLYYNYAVVADNNTEPERNVGLAMLNLSGGGGSYGSSGVKGSLSGAYYKLTPYTSAKPAMAPILSKITPDMTDRQKAEICIQGVVERIDYEVNGGASWTNDNPTGDCSSYAMMLYQIFGACNIPAIHCAGSVGKDKEGHAWVQAKLDGTWYVIDGTMAESGFSNGGIMPFEEHERAFDYGREYNDWDPYRVARALIDCAYPY